MFTGISSNKMPIIVHCPGSVKLSKQFPESSKIYQESLVHWLTLKVIKDKINPWDFLGKAPINDQFIDREMIIHVLNYCKILETIGLGSMGDRYEIIHGQFVGFSGKPNYMSYNQETEKLTIVDLKYGFVPVSALNNWQLLSYAWIFNNNYPILPIKSLKFGIYQPRILTKDGIYKTWEIPFKEFQQNYVKKIQKSLQLCRSENAMTISGEHCHHCVAMLQCDTNLESCIKIVNVTNATCGYKPTNGQLRNQLKLFRFALDVLKKRLQVVESVIETRLKNGEYVPGYHLEFSNGNRYWDISLERAKRLGIPNQPQKLMTPRQAEISGFPLHFVEKYTKTRMSIKLTETNINEINERLKN